MARNVVGHHTEREFQNVDMTENSAARDGPLGRKNADHTVCKLVMKAACSCVVAKRISCKLAKPSVNGRAWACDG